MNDGGPETRRLAAHAKVTLTLAVTGRRPDGYHLLDAEMVSVSLADELIVTKPPGAADPRTAQDHSVSRLNVTGPYAAGVPTDASNLVAKALDLVGRTADVTIGKHIPHGGGLGGGSTDAAAILRWAEFDNLEAASRIGADIPFCMIGGRARVRGVGEIVEPLPFESRQLTLVIPPIHVSTPAVYRAYAEGHRGSPTGNDLEAAATTVAPELATWRHAIIDACHQTPMLAGSGATWFVEGKHDDALAALRNEGAEVIAVETVPAY